MIITVDEAHLDRLGSDYASPERVSTFIGLHDTFILINEWTDVTTYSNRDGSRLLTNGPEAVARRRRSLPGFTFADWEG